MAEVRGTPLAELCRALDENADAALGGTWPSYGDTRHSDHGHTDHEHGDAGDRS